MKILNNARELPDGFYSGYLLPTEEAAKLKAGNRESYLLVTKTPKMIILFLPGISEINNKN